jgi:hypothetical protein
VQDIKKSRPAKALMFAHVFVFLLLATLLAVPF